MQVSCKVSYSVIIYIERQGVQLEPFFENFETPMERLRDPGQEVSVETMESFLQGIVQYVSHPHGSQWIREIGQSSFELRAWGVLDSVLKMVEAPKDIFSQPDRFLSYFLQPHPELAIIESSDNRLTFRLSKEPKAPLVLSYLIGAVEGLPNYTGRPQALIEHQDPQTFQISWFDDQQSLFDEQERRRRQFHPEIVHSVMQSLQDQQNAVGVKPEEHPKVASEAFEKMVALEVEKRMDEWLARHDDIEKVLSLIRNDFFKMYDYFTRAQQIITLISPTARRASVKEAMRRVDWEHVQKEFPKMVENACDAILSIKDTIHSEARAPLNAESETSEDYSSSSANSTSKNDQHLLMESH